MNLEYTYVPLTMDTLNTRIFPSRHFPKNFLRASLAETKAIITRNKVDHFDYLDYTAYNLQRSSKQNQSTLPTAKQSKHYTYNYHVFLSDVTFCIFEALRMSPQNKTIQFSNVHFYIQHLHTFPSNTTIHGSLHISHRTPLPIHSSFNIHLFTTIHSHAGNIVFISAVLTAVAVMLLNNFCGNV